MESKYQRKKELLQMLLQYMQAMVDDNPDVLTLAEDVRATYNGETVAVGDTELWKYVLRYASRQTYVDDKTHTAVLFATVTNEALLDQGGKKNPKHARSIARSEDMNRSQTYWWFYFLRLTFRGNAIAEVEEISIPEKLVHFNVHASAYPTRVAKFDNYVPESERSTREEMIAIADTYWEGIQKTIKPGEVLAHPDSGRLEMGVDCIHSLRNFHTMQSNFRSELFLWKIENRRWYVVDEERGVLVCLATFRQVDDRTPPGFIAAELFKIECGLIRDVLAFFKPMCTESGWEDLK